MYSAKLFYKLHPTNANQCLVLNSQYTGKIRTFLNPRILPMAQPLTQGGMFSHLNYVFNIILIC